MSSTTQRQWVKKDLIYFNKLKKKYCLDFNSK